VLAAVECFSLTVAMAELAVGSARLRGKPAHPAGSTVVVLVAVVAA